MQPEASKYIFDIKQAVSRLQQFTAGKLLEDYLVDELLQSAVERQFEIIGEAINKLSKVDSEAAASIPHFRKMISFRNILIHAYDRIDPRIVWGVIESDLNPLHCHLELLLNG